MPAPPLFVIENLTLPFCWSVVWPRLLWRRLRGAARLRVFAVDASRVALWVARTSAAVLGISVQRLAFRLVDIHDEEGRLVRLRITFGDLAEVQEEVLSGPAFLALKDAGDMPGRVLTYLAKQMTSFSASSRDLLWRTTFLVQLCVWQRARLGTPTAETLLVLQRRPGAHAIRRYAERFRVQVLTVPATPAAREVVRNLLGPSGIGTLHLVRHHLARARALLQRSRGARASAPLPRTWAAPTVVVPYLGHLNLSRPEKYSDLFFWQQSDLDGRDIIVAFQSPADPLDGPKLEELSRHGMRPIVLHSAASRVHDIPLFVPRAVRGGGRLGLAAQVRGSGWDDRWLRAQLDTYDALRAYWMDLCARLGARVYVTWHKYEGTHCVIADALEALGGVTAIYQRAYEGHPSAETMTNADIMFGYSAGGAELERASRSTIRYHVTTGYLGDHRFPLLREAAKPVRRALEQAGARFIIAYTDENSMDDSRWHTGHEFMRVNYVFLLERLLETPWLGLVLKPKVPRTLRRRLGAVTPLLERALATGRCRLFEGGAMHGSHPPALAALCADVMIHGHLCAATAGMEAALAGVPTLLLDREGWPVSPLYRLGVGRVVFQDWEDLWRGLMEYRRQPGGVPGFGDWSAMLPDLDPFRDGLAARRMGEYLAWLIEGFKAREERDVVMTRAAERYAARWGDDKIMEIRGPWGYTPTGDIERVSRVEAYPR